MSSNVVIGDPSQPCCPATPNVPSPQLFSLAGKHVLLTGGTRGIGQACAVALAQAGASICLAIRPQGDAQAALKVLPRETGGGIRHSTVEADLSNMQQVKDLFPKAVEEMGGKIDVLVNCAGIQRRHKSEEFPEKDWDEVCLRTLF